MTLKHKRLLAQMYIRRWISNYFRPPILLCHEKHSHHFVNSTVNFRNLSNVMLISVKITSHLGPSSETK
jgi:hypothetical protein